MIIKIYLNMEQPPALKDVISVINTLHYDSDPQSKQKASLWLDQLQKSVHAWKIADELLREKPNLEVCYFAAQTMRSKIQFSFHELPQESYVSLKDSLMDHLSQVTPATQNVIVTQVQHPFIIIIVLYKKKCSNESRFL
ncbi:Trn-SR [Cordylochernes scorpioides]|uniref:Trn-SR n=1 Tax=Cordylochernes scorpioides TaxID=51811 RepID=A0ABY6KQS7_9ARAC|nr:Trn-SR [Cordylochernes scorpioides]